MAKIKGVCHNYEGCDMASEKVVQEVEKSNFVCQECGKPLYAVKQQPQPWWKKHQRELTLGAGVLIIGGGITGGILAFSGDKEEPAKEPAKVQTEQVDSTKVDSVVAQPQAEEPKAAEPKAAEPKAEEPKVDVPKVKQPAGGGGVSSTSKNLGYGKYEGAMKNGQPHGTGTIYYTTRHQVVPSKDIYAESGDYVTGSFRDGKLMSGQLHRKDGNQEFVQR
ncbi:MAG: hypothetical protein PUC38_06160 [Bacteroidales bacterium]|nr:hypothetical protein [Bacteroidales bacterium]